MQHRLSETDASDALAALGNVTRLKLFRLLVTAGPDGLTVGEIGRFADVPGSTLNHHIQFLARAGLVVQERNGRSVITRADYGAMDALIAYLTDQCCAGLREQDRKAPADDFQPAGAKP